jgi:hypothetical protein
VCQLCNGYHAALELGDLGPLGVVLVDQIPCCQEIGHLVALCAWQLLDLLTEHNADPFEERRECGVVLPCSRLLEKRELVGSLVSKDEKIHDCGGDKGIVEIKVRIDLLVVTRASVGCQWMRAVTVDESR